MAKEKKKRKDRVDENNVDDEENSERGVEIPEDKPRKNKAKGKDSEDDTPRKKKRRKSEKLQGVVQSQSASVHFDSLQSIFASKDEEEGQFTLFGSDPVIQTPTITRLPVVVPSSVQQVIDVPQSGTQTLYFFPTYDNPKKNAQSLFATSDEPFFYNRTEYVFFLNLLMAGRRNDGYGMSQNTI